MSTDGVNGTTDHRPERAVLLAVDTGTAPWTIDESLDELEELTRTAGAEVVGRLSQKLEHPDPRSYLGRGKLSEARDLVHATGANLVIVDDELAPNAQKAMEEIVGQRVVDRTLLILDIFAQRARTHEGRVQVELARLEYLLPRLTRAWTHLERQVGGIGVRGGPGETQIEIDRRLIRTRIGALKRDIENIRVHRAGQRSARSRAGLPIVALVGYTNAGKSTLFNRLTGGEVLAADLLFATLDPTLRAVKLPNGANVILSDTVGFISDLPTTLIAAFRATLEEVIEADIIVHVRDISHPDSEAQARDVERVLGELGIEYGEGGRLIELWNKVDLVPQDELIRLGNLAARRDPKHPALLVSAITGAGLETLAEAIETMLSDSRSVFELTIAPENGEGLSWLYRNTEVLRRAERSDGATVVRVRADRSKEGAIERRFPERTRLAGFDRRSA
jgi:GTP-binding protein HflX